MDEKIRIDLDPKTMTIDEIETLEDLAGEPSGQLMSALAENRLNARGLRALVVVMKRREDPSFTIDQTGDLRLSQIEWVRDEVTGPPSEGPASEAG